MKPLFPLLVLAGLTACSSSSPRSNYTQETSEQPTTPAIASEHVMHAPSMAAAPTTAAPTLQPNQPAFATIDEAIQSLYAASSNRDLPTIARTLGLPEGDIVTSDAAHNASLAQFFATKYDEFHNTVTEGDSRARVFIGKENLALASPLVRVDNRWIFDSAGGKQALIDRYIDENETATIGVCRAYVQAQYEYYAEDRDGDDVLEYAQHLGSSRGRHDGLYWHTEPDQPASPLGPLIADARASGYLRGRVHNLDAPKPYHGYIFRILTRQGSHAPGGAHDYIINNHMIAGFALIAYPAKYAKSGVMSFIVNSNGKVLERDLGPETANIAEGMAEYDPDQNWSLVTQ